jgi:WhiB family transcriptional regulator, redox-sensing transcriptional regulator
VDDEAGYQQATHTLVLFFHTGDTADNRRMRSRSDMHLDDLALDVDLSAVSRLGTDWQDLAECAKPGGVVDFFPARGESVRDAKEVCARCAVRSECLDFALRLKVAHGVWGGLSERERRTLRRSRHRLPSC